MSTIGDRLAEVRTDEALGVREFAKRLRDGGFAVSGAAVSKYERAESSGGGRKAKKIPGDYLAAVCKEFGVRAAWLLLDHEPKYGRDGTGPDPFAEGVAYAVDSLTQVAEELRAKVAPKSRFRHPPPGDDGAGDGPSSPPGEPDGGRAGTG